MYIAPSERRDPRPTRRLKEHLLRRQTECSLHGPTIRYEIFSANGCEPSNALRSPSPGPDALVGSARRADRTPERGVPTATGTVKPSRVFPIKVCDFARYLAIDGAFLQICALVTRTLA